MSDGFRSNDRPTGPVTDTGQPATDRRTKIKVNGIEIEVTTQITAAQMLEEAAKAGAIEGMVADDEYVVERVKVEGEIGHEELITVIEFEEFMAVPTGKTPVAA